MTKDRKIFFEKAWKNIKLDNLIKIQTQPFSEFLQKDVYPEKRLKQGLQELFEEVFPIVSYDETIRLEFISYRFAEPKYNAEECIERGITYEMSLIGMFRLVDDSGIKEEEVFLGNIPIMTENGAFIINGAERVLVSQIHRAPGIYFEQDNSKSLKSGFSGISFKIIPYRGSWIISELCSDDMIYVYMERNKKRRRVLVTTLLRAIGLSTNEDILDKFFESKKVSVKNESEIGSILGSITMVDIKDDSDNIIVKAGDSLTTSSIMQIIKLGIKEFNIADGITASDPIIKMLREDESDNHRSALKACFRKIYPDEPATLSNARFGLMKFFFDKSRYSLGKIGRYKINSKFGDPIDDDSLDNELITQRDIVNSVKYMLALKRGDKDAHFDDIDNLSNRRLRLCSELIYNHCRMGVLRIEKTAREKLAMTDSSIDSITPGSLVSSKMLSAYLKELFTRSQLAQFMDQTNPISEVTHKRRISALGPGGITRDRAGFEVRDVHTTHYGRICPIETPEGPSIGLITSLAVYARPNKFGFIETPYFKVSGGVVSTEHVYLSADKEYGKNIAQATTAIDEDGKILQDNCVVRHNGEIMEVSKDKVDLIDVSPSQIFSISTNLIPFIEHDDSNRALMGSNMQRQAVPILSPEAPIVGTGFERKIAEDSGSAITASCDGIIEYVDGKQIILNPSDDEKSPIIISLKKFKRSNNGSCINFKPTVYVGQKVSEGECLADGSAIKDGELALGRNILVAFMPYYGYSFEDAIIVSEELIKDGSFTCVRVEKLELMARDTKLGQEEITRDIPNVSEDTLKNLDEDGIIKVGSRVSPGDILVGKVTPKLETELSPEERFLRAIFKDKAQSVKDTSLIAPVGTEGVVIDVRIFSRKDRLARSDDEIISESSDVKRLKKEYKDLVESIEKEKKDTIKSILEPLSKFPDVLIHRRSGAVIANKDEEVTDEIIDKISGISSNDILDIGIKEYLELRNSLQAIEKKQEVEDVKYKQVVNEVKKGDSCLETGVLKHVVIHIAKKSPLENGDKMAGRHGNKGVLSAIVPQEDMPYMSNGKSIQMILNTLGVPSRMNIGQIAELHLGWAGYEKGENISCPAFRGCSEERIWDEMRSANLPENGKTILYNGINGNRFQGEVAVGYMYMLRLAHFVSDKIHARAIGPYSFITQQPLGGKSRFGGQRFGEMEVWAIESYGCSNVLLELLTAKSDDVTGRTLLYQNIVKGDPRLITTQTESLRVLIKELQGLCLDARIETPEGTEAEIKSSDLAGKDFNSLLENNEEYQSKLDKLTMKLASDHIIRNVWSHGEVKKSETINYRTLRPERGGLFCEKIFGPTVNWECACGKYKKVKNQGIVCDRCGVEVTLARVRRERMAHIDLAVPVVHIWLLKNVPSRLGNLLGMSIAQLERIVYYEQYVVIDPKDTGLTYRQTLTHQEYQEVVDKFGIDSFEAKIGAEAIKKLLQKEDIRIVSEELKQAVKKAKSIQTRSKLARRLKIIESFLKSGNDLDSLILSCIPVIPPDVRPLIKLDGGRFATSDVNDLYRRVIHRNNRLKVILKIIKTPDVIVRNEMRLLQESVDALFDNGRRGTTISGAGNRALKPIAQSLRGKHGRFRQNLLGKRVDYSGRSVIVVGPSLKINQCGLPKEMALQLFEPFIVRRLRITGKARTVKSARKMIQRQSQEVWDILEDVAKNHTVILNRAPTLHRLSIQAFQPVLVEGKAIRVHPLVCAAFNADFDGDQMAVHVPLSVGAQVETKMLMMAADNIFLPASGKPIAMPTRDMILGVYNLTIDPLYDPIAEGNKVRVFSSTTEVLEAIHSGDQTSWDMPGFENKNNDILGTGIFLHEKILLKSNDVKIYTTPGIVLFNTVVPKELGFQNYVMTQQKLSSLIMECYNRIGLERTVVFLDDLKELGFNASTYFSISIGLGDISKVANKKELLEKASKQIAKIKQQHAAGSITDGEMESKEISIWTAVSDEIAKPLFKSLEQVHNYKRNPLSIILDSGSRGNKSQIRQLGGMRGLVARPSGSIITFPIRSSFREGLSPIEFFISTHGARKGLADTALKTADAGYLTRRLVDVAQEIIIREDDCKTINSIDVSTIAHMNDELMSLQERIIGRTSAEDIILSEGSEPLVKKNEIITEEMASKIYGAGIVSIKIRSPLTCLTERGVCSKCYGINLADGKQVVLGEAVGIIAAQSIGEPGTQLTMRTFHLGGVASAEVQPEWKADKDGIIVYLDVRAIAADSEDGNKIYISACKSGTINIVEDTGHTLEKYEYMLREKMIEPIQSFNSDLGARILIKNGSKVKAGDKIAEIETHSMPIIAEQRGKIVYEDLVEGVTTERIINKLTQQEELTVKQYRHDISPQINIISDSGKQLGIYSLPPGAVLSVKDGSTIIEGETIARIPRSSMKTKDITGGLSRVAEIFEARNPSELADISGIEGVVEFRSVQKGKRTIAIVDPNDPSIESEHYIPLSKHLIVQKGERVTVGQQLTNGIASLDEILKVCGIKYLQRYMVDQVQEVYKLQGVDINDKHIEIIVRQMLSKVMIIDHGDTTNVLYGDEITMQEFTEINNDIIKSGGKPAKSRVVISGITQAALNTPSLISAASFQNPTQGLLDAAFRGIEDKFLGCKENLIVAKKMPAGTGFKIAKHGTKSVEEYYCDISQFQDTAYWKDAIKDLESSVKELYKLIDEGEQRALETVEESI